jgi:hypothetical protein
LCRAAQVQMPVAIAKDPHLGRAVPAPIPHHRGIGPKSEITREVRGLAPLRGAAQVHVPAPVSAEDPDLGLAVPVPVPYHRDIS